ncbi:MAG TPA: hypothetical protein VFZ11_00340 [Gemmatimonadaceae bacterium]
MTPPAAPTRRRTRIVRWQGLVAFALLLGVLALGWTLLGDRVVESTAEEATTKLLGATVEIDGLRIRTAATSLDVGALRIADPFDPMRNLIDARDLVLVLEPEPLLEKKLVVRRLVLGDVRFGTARERPAPPAPRDGFAAQTLGEIRRWAGQFERPLLSFTPIDTLKQLVLDPAQLATVREAQALAAHADSVRGALEAGFRGLALQATLDSARALVARLEGANPVALGIEGTRRAVADVRRTLDEVNAAKRRVESLATDARSGARALERGLQALDSVRRADYAFARSLLEVPTIEGPALGNALFGDVSIERFQQAVYWAELAQRHMPPGLAPRERTGPERVRMAGTTVRFPKAQEYPTFLLRSGEARFTLTGVGGATNEYVVGVANVTSAPTMLGKPAVVAARGGGAGNAPLLALRGALDHTGAEARDRVTGEITNIVLPGIDLPGLPWRLEPGVGGSRLELALAGERIDARWTLRADAVRWVADSARLSRASMMETFVGRVITGIPELELDARLTGTMAAPSLSVRSNLDRVLESRLRAVLGEEIARAEAKARAAVDSIVQERTAPLRARVAEVRADAERRVEAATASVDEARAVLDERLKSLTTGVGGILARPK